MKPNDTKTDFYERLQGVIDGVANKDLILLLGDLNAKVEIENTSSETVMGKHGVGKIINQNGELFADFCSFNELLMGGGGSVFPTRMYTRRHRLLLTTRLRTRLTTSA